MGGASVFGQLGVSSAGKLGREGDRWRQKSVSGEIIGDTCPKTENNKLNKLDLNLHRGQEQILPKQREEFVPLTSDLIRSWIKFAQWVSAIRLDSTNFFGTVSIREVRMI